MEKAEEAIKELETRGLRIQYINITQLSDKRKEAHPSIYRKHWKKPSKEELSNPSTYSDCVHWCLPGVPDVWNEFLYAHIMYSWTNSKFSIHTWKFLLKFLSLYLFFLSPFKIWSLLCCTDRGSSKKSLNNKQDKCPELHFFLFLQKFFLSSFVLFWEMIII